MAFNELLADRIRQILRDKKVNFEDRKMMGGWCVMVDDKMCVGIIKEDLMARVDPDQYDHCLAIPGCKEMDFTGKVLKGYVLVEPLAVDTDSQLEEWVQRCLDYNPKAKSSKKKAR